MKLVRVGIAVDQDYYEVLEKQALLVKRSRNNLINLIFERVSTMTEEELLVFLHPTTKSHL